MIRQYLNTNLGGIKCNFDASRSGLGISIRKGRVWEKDEFC